MHRVMRRLRSLRGKRLAAAVAVSAAVVAGIVIGTMASLGGAAATNPALARATTLDAVVAQVRHNFGDHQIVSASREGSVVSVRLDFPGNLRTPGYGVRGVFEAEVLGAAVAEWMRAHGQEPATTVRFRNRGKVIPGWSAAGYAIEPDPHLPSLSPGACVRAAESAGPAHLTLVSARTLPYLNGTRVFAFRAADRRAAAGGDLLLGGMISAIGGPPDERPWLFELDDPNGVPRSGESWVPVGGGVTWTSPHRPYYPSARG
jgi:hypothetical protein